MSLSIMLQGTASDVGKSTLVAGLCRIFSQDGYRTAPFKSQNMALNSGITPDGKEMGRAQAFQAEAAGIAPDVRMNPILLKPTSDRRAQIVLMGKVASDMDAVSYHDYKPRLRETVREVYQSLAAEYEVMVLEGAGSPAEINLRDRDIVNMGMAELAQCPVILVADIDRGGVFAAIYGTLALLQEHERWRVKGVIINKFRGDVALQRGKYRDVSARALDIAVIQLPHISNFTDFNPLAAQPDVRVRYVTSPQQLNDADLLLLPGSKNTLGDLHWLRESGLAEALLAQHREGTPVIGICGGYQMLGTTITDEVESGLGERPGLGLLEVTTRFAREKVTTRVTGEAAPVPGGLLQPCAHQPVTGYEIHMGETTLGEGTRPMLAFCDRFDGAVSRNGLAAGCYLHGLFDNGGFTRALLDALRQRKGLAAWDGEVVDYAVHKQQQFDLLAQSMRQHIDIERLYQIMRDHKEPN